MITLKALLPTILTIHQISAEIALGTSSNNNQENSLIPSPTVSDNNESPSKMVNTNPSNNNQDNIVTTVNVLEFKAKYIFRLDYRPNALAYTIYKDDAWIFKIRKNFNVRSNLVDTQSSSSSSDLDNNTDNNKYIIDWFGDSTYRSKFEIRGNYLYIKNAELQDEAKYGCHYEIKGARQHENIVNKKLAVVRIPNVVIDTRENLVYKPNTSNRVFKVARCSAQKAKPAAELEFEYLGGGGKPKNWKVQNLASQDDGVDVYSHIEVLFSVRPEMNNTKVRCRVSRHPALELDDKFKREDSVKELTLDIDYPPQETTIYAISETELKCQSNANPAASYSWWYNQDMLDSDQPTLNLQNRTEILQKNGTVICQASNMVGSDKADSIPRVLIDAYAQELAQTQSAGVDIIWVVIAVVAIVLLILCCYMGYHFYTKNKSPRASDEFDTERETDEEKQHLQGGNGTNSNSYLENGNIAKANLNTCIVTTPGSNLNNMNTFDRRINEHHQQNDTSLEKETYGNAQDANYGLYTPSQQNMSFGESNVASVSHPANHPPETVTNNDTQPIIQVKTPEINHAIYDNPNEDNPSNLDKMYFDDPTLRPK